MQTSLIGEALGGLVALSRQTKPEMTAPNLLLEQVLKALHQFDACVRYLKTRRGTENLIEITSEANVQDILYLLLRPWIRDLTYESPGEKTGNRFAIKDFASSSSRFVIDAKYIRNNDHGKTISRELHDDIEMYRSHPDCDHLIFLIYDPEGLIPDQRALRETIEIERSYGPFGEKKLRCYLIVKP